MFSKIAVETPVVIDWAWGLGAWSSADEVENDDADAGTKFSI